METINNWQSINELFDRKEIEDKIKGNSVLVEEILMNPEQQNSEEEK